MIYRVVLTKRFQSDGNESEINPAADLDVNLPDGVVADREFVSRLEPQSQHSQEVMDEDDGFLGMASAETWDYDVVDSREQDFLDALANSEVVMEYSVVDETPTDDDDLSQTNLDDSDSKAPDHRQPLRTATRGGSGVRSVDDASVGQPTGDASAGEMTPSRPFIGSTELEGISDEGSSGIDDLHVKGPRDKSLGLTDVDKNDGDWAADTGPTVNPGRSAQAGKR